MPLDTCCRAYDAMACRWPLLHDLMGDTKAMRDAGEKWLPMEEGEEKADWQRRRDRTVLYGGLKGAHKRLVSEPFRRPVTITDKPEEPSPLALIEDAADIDGRNITQFARAVFADMALYGLGHVLVDMPSAPEGLSLGEERELGLRPRFSRIAPPDLIGWEVDENHDLIRIRIREVAVVAQEDFTEVEHERIRVYGRDSWQLYEVSAHTAKDGKREWVLIDEGRNTLGRVPLLTAYWEDAEGPLQAMPPLMDLAWLNLAHWQSSSDQRNILHVARVPFLWASGWTKEEIERGVTIGVGRLKGTENEKAKLGYVEHSGNAIQAGERDLRALEEQMEALGAQPLMQRSGDVTATAKAIDEGRSQSELQAAVRSLEALMLACYETAADWIGEDLPEEFGLDVFSEFTLSQKSAEHMEILDKARARGDIPVEDYLGEMQRRGVFDERTDIEAMLNRREKEQAAGLEAALAIAGDGAADDDADEEAA